MNIDSIKLKLSSLLLPAAAISAVGFSTVLSMPHSADLTSNIHRYQSSFAEGGQRGLQARALKSNDDFHATLRTVYQEQDHIRFSTHHYLSNIHHGGRKIMSESLFGEEGQEEEKDGGLLESFPTDGVAAVPEKGEEKTETIGENYVDSAATGKSLVFQNIDEVAEKVDEVNKTDGGIFTAEHDGAIEPEVFDIIDDALTAQEMKQNEKEKKKMKKKTISSGKSGKSSSSKSSSKSKKRLNAKKKNKKKKKKQNQPTMFPTMFSTSSPTIPGPTFDPTTAPSGSPKIHLTNNPSISPSDHPTINPTSSPTIDPTNNPTKNPTSNPSNTPSTFP
ncbi:hypothetical protein ACHAXS_001417, partial [Conticribra weissflogii]